MKRTSKELLKAEIDRVPDRHLDVVLRVARALEQPAPAPHASKGRAEWKAFVAETYGCMAEAPMERPPQGTPEVRDPLE